MFFCWRKVDNSCVARELIPEGAEITPGYRTRLPNDSEIHRPAALLFLYTVTLKHKKTISMRQGQPRHLAQLAPLLRQVLKISPIVDGSVTGLFASRPYPVPAHHAQNLWRIAKRKALCRLELEGVN